MMKELSIEEIKKRELDILIDVADFCDKNNIRYYLTGGTLLGAIRHKGFIPWDDDIDIQMPRPDYERFIREYKSANYDVCCWELDKNFLCTYAKISDNRTILRENVLWGKEIGVNIDLFPVDGLPQEKKKMERIVNRMKNMWGLVVCATINDISQRSTLKKFEITLMRAVYSVFPIKSWITGQVIKKAQKYRFDNSDKVATLVWGYGLKEIINKSTACNYEKRTFEGHLFNVPVDYEDYLVHIYGEYMKLPPKEERIYKHDIKVYMKIG